MHFAQNFLLISLDGRAEFDTRKDGFVKYMAEEDLWNILERTWLEASTHRGEWRMVSPLELLRAPGSFRAIAASSPLDEFAALRFLTTLLYWKADEGGGISRVRSSLLQGELSAEVVNAIAAERDSFNLFDAKRPFLQDPAIDCEADKPVGSLFSEIATGTNIAHFDHSRDLSSPLCIPCVVRGMLRLVPWSQSGGSGLTPSIHGAPPIALLPRGPSIAETLARCLVDTSLASGFPTWTGTFHPTNPNTSIPLLEGLTWNPRRVRIARPSEDAHCRLCGMFGPAISSISFKKNDAVKKPEGGGEKLKTFDWRDPAFRYRPEKAEPVRSGDEKAAALSQDIKWLRDAQPVTPTDAAAATAWSVVIPCTNPANNKTFDHRRVEVLPGADLRELRVEHDGAEGLALGDRPLEFEQAPRSSAAARIAVERFVGAAVAALDETDWIALRRAEGRTMHEEPEAFAVFSAIYWRVRSGGRSPLRRNAAWLLLKLMALAPSSRRSTKCSRRLAELLDAIPTRQAHRTRSDTSGKSPYPIAPSQGLRLEIELAAAIQADLAANRDIPWLELGTYLNDAAR